MPYTPSPLRYPGGKTQLYNLVKEILHNNSLVGGTYVEPFAGGAGLAIKLLLRKDVNRIVINDFDKAIYSFWYSILYYTDKFCEFIRRAELTIDEWNYYRDVLHNSSDTFRLGFSTFYLNRTNVSGIIKGGVIGGKQQKGNYKMDARFNKDKLIKRIIKVAENEKYITLSNKNAIDFIDEFDYNHDSTFINFDPPYVNKGTQLYKNSFTKTEHINLSKKILNCPFYWIVTYDICDLVKELYSSKRYSTLDINYSVGNTRDAKEYIFFSDKLLLPSRFIAQDQLSFIF